MRDKYVSDFANGRVRVTFHMQQQIIQLLLRTGCRMADPENSPRALNGKLDLSQAEAVADLISSYFSPDCYATNARRFL
jgi:tRNA U34 5-carboxymethylaminomethyl modifying GTPase MnmE/TrmE